VIGRSFVLECSGDPAHWLPVSTNSGVPGGVTFTDTIFRAQLPASSTAWIKSVD
jgi:hypothetical protein